MRLTLVLAAALAATPALAGDRSPGPLFQLLPAPSAQPPADNRMLITPHEQPYEVRPRSDQGIVIFQENGRWRIPQATCTTQGNVTICQ